jgi:hypothetical protein
MASKRRAGASSPRAAAAKPRFAPEALRELAGDKVFPRGEAYHRAGQVELLSDNGQRVLARVLGTEVYRCELTGSDRQIAGHCTCPAFTDHGFCKHLVATGLAANAAAGAGKTAPDRIGTIRAYLRGLGAEKLAGMLLDLAERDPSLLERLDIAATAASGDAVQVGQRLRAALRRALGTGRRFIEYREAGGWARDVLDLLDQLEALVGAGQAPIVLDLLDDLFARIGRALENVDDSDGGGSEILGRAAGIHLAACRATRPEPRALARDLFTREMTDEWATFDGASDTYAELLGPEGLALYRQLAQEAWDKRPPGPRRVGRVVVMEQADVRRHTVFHILDRFAERDGDVALRITLRAAALNHPHDHLRLAQFCLAEGREAEALRRAEDGAWLFDDASGEALQRFLADRFLAAGRPADALATLWRTFDRRPSAELYRAMAAAQGDWPDAPTRVALADRAIALVEARLSAAKGATATWDRTTWDRTGLATLLADILLAEGRLAAAWAVARAWGLPDPALRRLAEASEAAMPEDALATFASLVERQVALTNRQGYTEACQLIARMGILRARRGEEAEHRAFVTDLLRRHAAKRSFAGLLRETLGAAASGEIGSGPQRGRKPPASRR